MTYSELKKVCESRKMQVSDVACHIGMTYQGLKAGMQSGKLASDKVLALCKTLEISPNAFYGWEQIMPLGPATPAMAIELLREQLSIKDKQISDLLSLLHK